MSFPSMNYITRNLVNKPQSLTGASSIRFKVSVAWRDQNSQTALEMLSRKTKVHTAASVKLEICVKYYAWKQNDMLVIVCSISAPGLRRTHYYSACRKANGGKDRCKWECCSNFEWVAVARKERDLAEPSSCWSLPGIFVDANIRKQQHSMWVPTLEKEEHAVDNVIQSVVWHWLSLSLQSSLVPPQLLVCFKFELFASSVFRVRSCSYSCKGCLRRTSNGLRCHSSRSCFIARRSQANDYFN